MFDWGTYVNGGRPDPTWCAPFTVPSLRVLRCIYTSHLFVCTLCVGMKLIRSSKSAQTARAAVKFVERS